jgi:hypothetical protein
MIVPMAYVTIRFPDELLAKAETRAAEAGHASVDEYLQALVSQDAGGGGPPAAFDPLSPVGDAEVEAMLLRRLESTARDVEGAAEVWKPFGGGGRGTGL